jgi:AraC-like DNA-binding protein
MMSKGDSNRRYVVQDGDAMTFFNTHDMARLSKVAAICGFDMDALLLQMGATASACLGPEGRWDANALELLYTAGLKLSLHAHFPFVLGELFQFDRVPEADIFLTTSTTLQDALSVLGYLPSLLQPDTIIWTEVDAGQLHIFAELQQDGLRLTNSGFSETLFVILWRLLQQASASAYIQHLSFRHQPLQPIELYVAQFGVCPTFNAPFNQLTLAQECLSQKLPSASPTLHAQAKLLLEKRIQRHGIHSRLEQTIELMVMQSPTMTLSDVCQRLGLEPRSLQRRLKDEGVAFHDIHANARFFMAQLLLSNPAIDIESIATKLGFADRHSFSRAFSKWAGVSPGQYRRQA